jgi:predicted nucleotide-binding protein
VLSPFSEAKAPGLSLIEADVTVMKSQDPRAVAVVYGRNAKAKAALFDFLRALGLTPKEWGQLVKDLGQGSPYIGHVVKGALERAQAIVVLLTGDDEAQLREEFRGKFERPYEVNLTPQPRQNVLFEATTRYGLSLLSSVNVGRFPTSMGATS